jgi:hypothetical protein
MKHLAVCALLLLAACSSANSYPVTPPDVNLVQIYGPSNLDYSRGVSSIDAEYGIQVRNNADVPIRLKHATLESVGGTTIVLRREDRSFDIEIPPGQIGQATMHARVYFSSDLSGSPTREPLTLRATMHFDSPKGAFNKIVQRNIGQFPGQ